MTNAPFVLFVVGQAQAKRRQRRSFLALSRRKMPQQTAHALFLSAPEEYVNP